MVHAAFIRIKLMMMMMMMIIRTATTDTGIKDNFWFYFAKLV